MDTGRGKVKSLNVVRTPYIQLLKQDLPHKNYFDSFLCAQTPEICEDGPTRNDMKVSKSNLKFSLPYPISEPEVKAIIEDPCFELVKRKQTFLKKLECAKKRYQYDKHWLTKDKILKDQVEFVPEYLYELTNGKSADVDPYFNSCYDFYYTGGNLCKIQEGDEMALIYPDCAGNIFCTNVKTTQTTPLIKLNGGSIYNIKSYSNKHFTVRHKHEINVVKVKFKHGNYKAKALWNINSSDVPLNDCDLLSDNEICYTDMEQNLKILDVGRGICKCEHKFCENEPPKCDDGLLQVKYIDENILSIMGRDYVSIFDQRSSTCSVYPSGELFFKCNHYCAFCLSRCSDNYLYVGTKHNVLKFDLRKMGVVKKWTHFMSLDPNVVKAGKCNDEEVVCISGFVDSVCFSTGDPNYMPVRLMNTKVAFDECRVKKKFVFRDDLEERLGMGTVGVEFLEKNSDFAVFTCNSIGDVFRHNLKSEFKKEAVNIDEFTSWMMSFPYNENSGYSSNPADCNMDKFISWVDSVPELARPLSVTSVKNMKRVKRLLLKKPTGKLDEIEQNGEVPSLKPLMEYLDKYSEHNFSNIWSSGAPVDIGGVSTVSPSNKVSEWLQSTLHSDEIIKEDY